MTTSAKLDRMIGLLEEIAANTRRRPRNARAVVSMFRAPSAAGGDAGRCPCWECPLRLRSCPMGEGECSKIFDWYQRGGNPADVPPIVPKSGKPESLGDSLSRLANQPGEPS